MTGIEMLVAQATETSGGYGEIAILIALIIVAILISYMLLLIACYKPCEMDEALVRSGTGGAKVAIQGGLWVLPKIHKFTRVTLRSLKLDVKTGRSGQDKDSESGTGIKRGMGVMRSKDHLPIILDAEITVAVPQKEDHVLTAARTLGEKVDPKEHGGNDEKASDAIRKHVNEQIVSAIRGAAAMMTLDELHAERTRFTDTIYDTLEDDLIKHGLELISVAIESIDQEPIKNIEARAADSVFDASALASLTEKLQKSQTLQEKHEREQELTRLTQNTEFETGRLDREKEVKFAQDTQKREVANKTATEDATIETFYAETTRTKVESVATDTLIAAKKEEETARDLELFQEECLKEKTIVAAKYEREYMTEELERDRKLEMLEEEVDESIKIAETNRKRSVGIAQTDAQKAVGTAQEDANEAVNLARVKQEEATALREEEKNISVAGKQKDLADTETYANTAKAAAAQALASIETATTRERVKAEVIVPGEAEKARIRLEAEAERDQEVLAAEGMVAKAEGERDADLAAGAAADALLIRARAEAEELTLKNQARIIGAEADLLTKDNIGTYLLSKQAPELAGHLTEAVAAAFKPLENIEGMRILQVNSDGGGGANDSGMASLMKTVTNNAPAGALINEVLQMSGSDMTVRDLLEKMVGGVADMASSSSTFDSDQSS